MAERAAAVGLELLDLGLKDLLLPGGDERCCSTG